MENFLGTRSSTPYVMVDTVPDNPADKTVLSDSIFPAIDCPIVPVKTELSLPLLIAMAEKTDCLIMVS